MPGELAATFGHEGGGTGLLHVVAPTAPARRGLPRIVIVEGGGELADVFAGMIEVEDFNRTGEGQAAVFPNLCRPVPYEDDLPGPIKTTPAGFLMEQYGNLAAAFVGADVAGGIGIAHGLAFVVPDGLGKDATEFGLAGPGTAVFLFSFDPFEFRPAHGGAGAVATEVKD